MVVATDVAPLAPGVVYVIPPGSHALVTPDRHVALIEVGRFPPNRPSADLLLSSMAVSVGPSAIAVVLSGRGHDGATGATAVHRFGGVVVATDEATSARFEMPSSAIDRDEIVDHVVALSEVAHLLVAVTNERIISSAPAT